MKIYIDDESKCHILNDGTMTAIETDFFNGKCSDYIEGHCFEIKENSCTIYAWKPYSELDAAQREYEKEKLADAENALAILLGGETG